MKICCYCNKADKDNICKIIKGLNNAPTDPEIEVYEDYEAYVKTLHSEIYDMVIVSMDGAGGMEGAISAKDADFHTPVAWFSDDDNFSLQAFRLNVDYFVKKPINKQKIESMFKRFVDRKIEYKKLKEAY